MQKLYTQLFAVALCLVVSSVVYGQTPSNQSLSAIAESSESSDWLRIQTGADVDAVAFIANYKTALGLGMSDELVVEEVRTDRLGFQHYRLQQMYEGIPVEFARYNLHVRNGALVKANGKLAEDVMIQNSVVISAEDAIASAIECVGAGSYLWEYPEWEAAVQNALNDPGATSYPSPELLIVDHDFDPANEPRYVYAYKMKIHAADPYGIYWVYIDAQTGMVVKDLNAEMEEYSNSEGIADTRYSGRRTIITDSTEAGFRLRESLRGLGVETYNANDSFDIFSASDFLDDNNFWNNPAEDRNQAALDAHWGSEMMYDYLKEVHGFDSYDNHGAKMISYVHYGTNWSNASWTGLWSQYGDATKGDPWTSISVVGHEIAHGLTQNTADLIYSREPGAINESFSDIWGESLERYATGTYDWYIAPSPTDTIRNMADPKSYGDPNTYLGENWHTSSAGNFGVHTNSGVMNYWFYLLVEGGQGVNDNGDTFSVDPVGWEAAEAIAFRNLAYYLTPSSQYYDARQGSLFATEDLYGFCSEEYKQVANAWHAVGVGDRVDVPDFTIVGVDNFPECNIGETERITVRVRYLGCDTLESAVLNLRYLKTNPLGQGNENLEINEPIAPGAIFEYTFDREANFGRFGEHQFSGIVIYSGDSNFDNNESATITTFKTVPIEEHRFTFEGTTASYRDSMYYSSERYASVSRVLDVGIDSSAAFVIEGDNPRRFRPVPEGEDVFDNNEAFGARICFCMDATDTDTLGMQFDLRQTASTIFDSLYNLENARLSFLRVIVDDSEELARYSPVTYDQDPWVKHQIDLSAYVGQTFKLCFESRTATSLQRDIDTAAIGDRIYLDNIEFVGDGLSTSAFSPTKDGIVKVFPNPASTTVHIGFETEITGNTRVELFNLEGRQVYSSIEQNILKGEIRRVDASGWAPGLYVLRLSGDSGVFTQKVLIQ